MVERCELTELIKDQCAHCRPAPPAEAPSYGPWFTASYGGECGCCSFPIASGDQIRADGEGGWLCQECGDEAVGEHA